MSEKVKNQAAVELGRKGGKAGTGASKRRSKDHYTVTLVKARKEADERRRAMEKNCESMKKLKVFKKSLSQLVD